ncbi:MAG: non-canonical purine NTP pyrophosphatase [bacterium]|nr:non-canonical purine NTP pyrophosphatase [bacterium]
MRLCFVTSSENKLKEAESILGFKIDKVNLDIKEIQSLDVEEIVKDKAEKAFDLARKPVMVEDTGFYIEAWKGFPGALIKWVLKTLGNDGLCRLLQDKNRTVIAKTCVCLYNGKESMVFCGEIRGKMPEKPLGQNGFGWDPIFMPQGLTKTFAQITPEEKDRISMRKIALVKMKDFLDKNPSSLN